MAVVVAGRVGVGVVRRGVAVDVGVIGRGVAVGVGGHAGVSVGEGARKRRLSWSGQYTWRRGGSDGRCSGRHIA